MNEISLLSTGCIFPSYTQIRTSRAYEPVGGQEYKMNVRDTQTIDLDWGGKLVFVNCIVGGAIDARFLPAILKGIMSRMKQGPLTASYAFNSFS